MPTPPVTNQGSKLPLKCTTGKPLTLKWTVVDRATGSLIDFSLAEIRFQIRPGGSAGGGETARVSVTETDLGKVLGDNQGRLTITLDETDMAAVADGDVWGLDVDGSPLFYGPVDANPEVVR